MPITRLNPFLFRSSVLIAVTSKSLVAAVSQSLLIQVFGTDPTEEEKARWAAMSQSLLIQVFGTDSFAGANLRGASLVSIPSYSGLRY